jgi:hypothetical protein
MKKFTLFTLLAIGISGVAVGDQDKKDKKDKDDKIADFVKNKENGKHDKIGGFVKNKDDDKDNDRSEKKRSGKREPEPLSLPYGNDEKRSDNPAPEIDPGAAASGLALLSGVLLVINGHRKK